MKVEFYKHNVDEEEKQKVLECLDGIFLTAGSYVNEFEKEFAQYLGLKYAVGLTSCTAALHLSLIALDIGPNDEVITTPMTFIATATSIIHAGATPVFIDVESETALIDPARIESAITERTKAIIPVHLYGQMCDMEKIRIVADKYNLKIIEDAAHCIEGERNGIRPGQLGDVACFSFYATKNITSGEGGAIATNHEDIAEKVLLLRQHGMSKEAAERYSGLYQHWDMLDCGWKYNMNNIQAALLLPQLRKIDDTWSLRSRHYHKYIREISGIYGVKYPIIRNNSKSSFHLFTVWIDENKRDEVLRKLGERGIGTAVNYRAIHLLHYFKENFGFKKGLFPIAEYIGASTISLPFFPMMTDQERNLVAQTLKGVMAEIHG